ncbi:retrovirus-related Pol polyprotein from transposon 412 [Trichonephila clavipes]|nr:retrovirus-related Pol polyprotein from transposon 412 [Trichonephila clavipes]
MDSSPMRLDLKPVFPTFIPDKDDISLFLTMFERQMKLLSVPAEFWVSHLIGVIPNDIGKFIAKEPKEMFRNYAHIPNISLQRLSKRIRNLEISHHSRSNKKCPTYYKNHFLDTWEKLNDPVVLAEKLDSYENVKSSS